MAAAFLSAVTILSGHNVGNAFSKTDDQSRPVITSVLVFPDPAKDDIVFKGSSNPDVVIRNDGSGKALMVSWDVKVYRYNTEKDKITACATQGLKGPGGAFFREVLGPSQEMRHSALGLSGDNGLAIYAIRVGYHEEPTTPEINIENYYIIENSRINDLRTLVNDQRYAQIMQKLHDFDLLQEPATAEKPGGRSKARPDALDVSSVAQPPLPTVQEGTPQNSQRTQPLSVQVNFVYREGGIGQVLPIETGQKLKSGDHYKIYFKADQDCYVYIYQSDAHGQLFRLFPLKQFAGVILNHENPVIAGPEYVLPAEDRSFYLDNITGREQFILIASFQRNEELEILENAMESAVETHDQDRMSKARQAMIDYLKTRTISGTIKTRMSPVAWKTGDTAAPVMGSLLECSGNDCYYAVEFFHR